MMFLGIVSPLSENAAEAICQVSKRTFLSKISRKSIVLTVSSTAHDIRDGSKMDNHILKMFGLDLKGSD